MGAQVLVVEDDPQILELVTGLLVDAGLDVVCAENGLEGLRRIVEHQPDLVLTDVLMPVMSGLEFCAVLKGSPQTEHIPVIFLSCVDDPVKGFDVGADDYVVKPFRPRELVARVRAVMSRARALPADLVGDSLRGSLSQVSVLEALQMLRGRHASGCLAVSSASGGGYSRIWLEGGEVVAAELEGEPDVKPELVVAETAGWSDGIFAFNSEARAERWTIEVPSDLLLAECAEANGLVLPPLSDAPPQAGSVPSAVDRDEAVRRVESIRSKLKQKAFEAMVQGRSLIHPGLDEAMPASPVDVSLPPEIEELIDLMFAPE